MTTTTTTLTSKITGQAKEVRYADPVWCGLENRRLRFCRVEGSAVVLMDDACRELPDWRHPSQVAAY